MLQVQPQPYGLRNKRLSVYNQFQMMNTGKGWNSKRMANEFRKYVENKPPKMETTVVSTFSGPALEVRPATGRFSRNAYANKLVHVPRKTVIVYDSGPVEPSTNVRGTFNEGFLGVAKREIKPLKTRPDGKWASKNVVEVFETAEGRAIKPNANIVFTALTTNMGWDRRMRAQKYEAWTDAFFRKYEFDAKKIDAKLKKIIIERKLNPSERVGVPLSDKIKRCEGETCWYDDKAQKCVKPGLDEMLSTIPQSWKDSHTPYQIRAREQSYRDEFEKGNVDLCAFGRARGEDIYFDNREQVNKARFGNAARDAAANTDNSRNAKTNRDDPRTEFDAGPNTMSDNPDYVSELGNETFTGNFRDMPLEESDDSDDSDYVSELGSEEFYIDPKEIDDLFEGLGITEEELRGLEADTNFHQQLEDYVEATRDVHNAQENFKQQPSGSAQKKSALKSSRKSVLKLRDMSVAFRESIENWVKNGKTQYVYNAPAGMRQPNF